mgnify:CR=1 FL=1
MTELVWASVASAPDCSGAAHAFLHEGVRAWLG